MATVCASLVARVVVERETGERALKIESEASWHLPQIHCGFRARTTNSEQQTRYISKLLARSLGPPAPSITTKMGNMHKLKNAAGRKAAAAIQAAPNA